MKTWSIACISLIFLIGCSDTEQNRSALPEEPETTKNTENDSSQEVESISAIADNLEIPWSINKTNDEFYISERTGAIAHIGATGSFDRQSVTFSSPLSSAAEAGFLGFVLKDDFSESSEAYAYYVYEKNQQSFNRIVVLSLKNGNWTEKEILLDEIPTGNVHHGGRLALDGNGVLFATIGDASNPDLAQNPESINGKILRLNESGQFDIYSSGHRNPQGIAWQDDRMFASEHGQSANDEINLIQKDGNYGWPVIEGTQEKGGLETPFYTTGPDKTWAPSGIAIHDHKIYIASLRGTAINVIDLQSGEVIKTINGFGRIRDVYIEGNHLYFITNNTDGRGDPAQGDDKLYQMTIDE